MKSTVKIVSLLFLSFVAFSCSKKDHEIKKSENPGTYIKYNIAGNSKNGSFKINNDGNNSNHNVTGMVVPNDDGNAALVNFLDGSQLISAGLAVPAAIGVTEITDTNPYGYAVGLGFEDISLQEKAISVHVTEIEFEGVILLHMKGSFTGTAVNHTHDESGLEIEEPHLVDGEFEYTSPAY